MEGDDDADIIEFWFSFFVCLVWFTLFCSTWLFLPHKNEGKQKYMRKWRCWILLPFHYPLLVVCTGRLGRLKSVELFTRKGGCLLLFVCFDLKEEKRSMGVVLLLFLPLDDDRSSIKCWKEESTISWLWSLFGLPLEKFCSVKHLQEEKEEVQEKVRHVCAVDSERRLDRCTTCERGRRQMIDRQNERLESSTRSIGKIVGSPIFCGLLAAGGCLYILALLILTYFTC